MSMEILADNNGGNSVNEHAEFFLLTFLDCWVSDFVFLLQTGDKITFGQIFLIKPVMEKHYMERNSVLAQHSWNPFTCNVLHSREEHMSFRFL